MTMNYRQDVLIIQIITIAILLPVLAYSGNLSMVEQRVEELGALNNEALKQVPGLPRDGTVDLKAHVTNDGKTPSIRIEEHQIQIKGSESLNFPTEQGVNIPAPAVEGAIEFSEKNRPGGDNVQQTNR